MIYLHINGTIICRKLAFMCIQIYNLYADNATDPFIQNFLSILYECYQELDKRFAVINSNKVTKMARIEATVLNSLLPISKAEICRLLPDVSPTTVEAVLGKMVKDGSIKKLGTARATKYVNAKHIR